MVMQKVKKEVDDFYDLSEMEWSDRISTTAHQTLKEKTTGISQQCYH